MASLDEIARRVQDTDTPRTARRSAAARQVGELAARRAGVVAALDEIEHQLGDVLIDTEDVIGDDELARFTDIKKADLARWRAVARAARKAPGRKRTKRPADAKPNAGTSTTDKPPDTAPSARPAPSVVDGAGSSASSSKPVAAPVA
jgi:hypothetical protein